MKRTFFLISILIGAIVVFQQCNVSTANISDVKMCESISDYQCAEDNPVFSPGTPILYVTCVLKNDPGSTNMKFAWYYYQGEERVLIDEVTVTSPEDLSTSSLSSNLNAPDAGWPVGNYEVVISMDTDNSTPIIKSYTVQ